MEFAILKNRVTLSGDQERTNTSEEEYTQHDHLLSAVCRLTFRLRPQMEASLDHKETPWQ